MPRPLLGHQQLIVRCDPTADQIEIVGMVAGPAGVASLELGVLTLEIDIASPTNVAFISIPQPSAPHSAARISELLTLLIGRSSSDRIMAMTTRQERTKIAVGRAEMLPLGPGEMVRPDVAELAIAMSQVNTPGLLESERAVALLEAVVLAGSTGLLAYMPQLSTDAALMLESLEQAGIEEVLAANPGLAPQLRDIFSEAVLHVEPTMDAIRLRSLIGHLAGRPDPEPTPSTPTTSAPSDTGRHSPFGPESLPALYGAPPIEFRSTHADEFEARIPGWAGRADDWWVRAFASNDHLPIAMVPFFTDDGDAVARLLLPRAHQDQVRLDVVDDPLEPLLSQAAAAFRVAVVEGQRAARYTRLGNDNAAAQAWHTAEHWHSRAGDDRRARQAAANAQVDSISATPLQQARRRPLITDHMDEIRRAEQR